MTYAPQFKNKTLDELRAEVIAATRRAKIAEIVGDNSILAENGFEVPDKPGQYLIIEYSCGDPVWATISEDLREAARDIEQSDTSRDDVSVIDLDTGKHLNTEMRITAFWCEGERITVDSLKAVTA